MKATLGVSRKGKRGRGATGKVPVFGLLKRGGKVYTAIIPDASSVPLIPIINEKVKPDSIVYTDFITRIMPWMSQNSSIHYLSLFAHKHNSINGIENFWNQAKRYMRKFNDVPKEYLVYF